MSRNLARVMVSAAGILAGFSKLRVESTPRTLILVGNSIQLSHYLHTELDMDKSYCNGVLLWIYIKRRSLQNTGGRAIYDPAECSLAAKITHAASSPCPINFYL